jgi:hypothetical protein
VSHPADLPHRWLLVDDEPAHALLAIAHPGEGAAHRAPSHS